MTRHPRWVSRILSDDDFDAITAAIAAAEAHTSGEIRVHLERCVPRPLLGRRPDALVRARHVFARLGMDRTAERHGVLVYLALEQRKLAIVGDVGIHARVGDDHWRGVRDHMVEALRRGAPRQAIVGAIEEIGRALAAHFPRRPDDRNELADDVSVS